MRTFNTTGPVRPDKHYTLPPLATFNLREIQFLIDQEKYFILHAPRQVGKTSSMLALMEYLNAQGTYHCLYINVEAAQAAREDIESAMKTILWELVNVQKITWMIPIRLQSDSGFLKQGVAMH